MATNPQPIYDLPITFSVTSWANFPTADELSASIKNASLWLWLILAAILYLTYRKVKGT